MNNETKLSLNGTLAKQIKDLIEVEVPQDDIEGLKGHLRDLSRMQGTAADEKDGR